MGKDIDFAPYISNTTIPTTALKSNGTRNQDAFQDPNTIMV